MFHKFSGPSPKQKANILFFCNTSKLIELMEQMEPIELLKPMEN